MVLLVFVDLIGFVISLIIFLIKAIRKQPLLKISIVELAFLGLFVVSFILVVNSPDDDSVTAESDNQIEEIGNEDVNSPLVEGIESISLDDEVEITESLSLVEEDVEELIHKMADRRVFGYVEDCLNNNIGLKDYSPTYSNMEIVDKDEYFRYLVRTTIETRDASENVIIALRILPDDITKYAYYYYLFDNHELTSQDYPEEWGLRPSDFDKYDEIVSAGKQTVEARELLAHKEKYNGKYVIISDELIATGNEWRSERLRTYAIRDEDTTDLDFRLNVIYKYVDNEEEWISKSISREHIKAEGFFRVIDDTNEYLEAVNIVER